MDRSFLSRQDVIDASRAFVCIRLTTYENEKEHEFCSQLFGRTAENTTFTILSPDAKKTYSRPSRGPHQSFRNATRLADEMNRIAKDYADSKPVDGKVGLPLSVDVRIGTNIAASDKRPFVILYADDDDTRKKLVDRVNSLAWSEKLIGQFVYATASKSDELKEVKGVDADSNIVIAQPGQFGINATVIQQAKSDISDEELQNLLVTAMSKFEASPQARDHFSHVRAGRQEGVFWETPLPVTDRMEKRARERTKASISGSR